GHVLVPQMRREPRLADERLHEVFVARDVRQHSLERDRSPEAFDALDLGAMHRRHAADAELFIDEVRHELLAGRTSANAAIVSRSRGRTGFKNASPRVGRRRGTERWRSVWSAG